MATIGALSQFLLSTEQISFLLLDQQLESTETTKQFHFLLFANYCLCILIQLLFVDYIYTGLSS